MPTFALHEETEWGRPSTKRIGWSYTYQNLDVDGANGGWPILQELVIPSTPVGGWTPPVGVWNKLRFAASFYMDDYYFRIWVIPDSLTINAARPGVDYGALVWNAYPWPNSFTSITGTGTGVSDVVIDQTLPTVFGALEIRTVNWRILENAPSNIDIDYTITFTWDTETLFRFVARRTTIMDVLPQVPVNETWSWLTDVIVSDDGTEQRIAMREEPRIAMSYSSMPVGVETIRRLKKAIWNNIGTSISIPFYQYATNLTAPANVGATTVSVDTSKTDLRVGEDCFLRNADGTIQAAQITAVGPSSVTFQTGIEVAVDTRTQIGPLLPCTITENTALSRYAVNNAGVLAISAQTLLYRNGITRPGATTVLPQFESLPVLDRVPLADNLVVDSFASGARVVDFGVGVRETERRWKTPQVSGSRTYFLARIPAPTDDFDYFRAFLDGARGRQEAFFTSTFRPDFGIITAPTPAGTTVTLAGVDYSVYFPNDAFKYLAFKTAAGPAYVRVLSVAPDGLGNEVVNFTPGFPSGPGYDQVLEASLLVKSRLDSDTVTFVHDGVGTYLTLAIKSVPA